MSLTGSRAARKSAEFSARPQNPLEVVVASSEQGNGVMGVIDGFRPKGVEDEAGQGLAH